jgi:hypothetical protein
MISKYATGARSKLSIQATIQVYSVPRKFIFIHLVKMKNCFANASQQKTPADFSASVFFEGII